MLLVVGMVLLAMSVIERRGRTARARAVSALADQIDFAFSTVDSYGLVDLPFSLFLQSGRGTAKLVISGTHNGLPLQIFDYEHRAGKQRDRYTCALLTIPTGCPWLRLVHENPLTRLADQVVHADVKLEYDDFNHRFLVNSADRKSSTRLIRRVRRAATCRR